MKNFSISPKFIFGFKNCLVFLFVLSIFFSTAINNISYALLLLISLFELYKKGNFKIAKWHIILCLILLYFIFDILFFGNFKEDNQSVFRYLIIGLTPFIFYNNYFIKSFKKYYLYAYAIFLIIIFYGVILNYINYQEFNFYTYGKNIKNYLFLERLYFGLCSMIASIFILDILKKNIKGKYFLLSLVFLANFLISSRLSTIFLTLVLLFELYRDFKFTFSYQKIIIVILSLAMGSFFVVKNEGLKERFFLNVSSFEGFIEEVKIKEPRFAIWRCFSSLVNDDEFPILQGFDTNYQIEKKLIDCYADTIYIKDKRNWFIKSEYNSHNQFFHLYLLHGLIASVLFLIFFLLRLIFTNQRIIVFLTIIVLGFLLIENAFFRQIGVYLISICISFICLSEKKLENLQDDN